MRDWAFKPLLAGLGAGSVRELERAVAVDRGLGGCGWIDLSLRDNSTGVTLMAPEPPKPGGTDQALFRANRTALRSWLAKGVDLRYEHRLSSLEGGPGDVKAVFENGVEVKGSLIIAADGLHSTGSFRLVKSKSPMPPYSRSTVRRTLLPHIKPALLLVVVFHSDVYMPRHEFETVLKPSLGDSNVLGGVGDNFNTPITIANADSNGVHLDWSYSRAIQGARDPLWMPDRDQSSVVPDQLLKEIGSKTLVAPFSTLLNIEAIKKGKVHNWLSRSVFIPQQHLDQAAKHGVMFVGDSAHAMPIFGGEGGNHAMLDGVELARLVIERGYGENRPALTGEDVELVVRQFYDGAYKRCQDAVRRCRQRFALLHRPLAEWKQLAEMAKARAGKAQVQT